MRVASLTASGKLKRYGRCNRCALELNRGFVPCRVAGCLRLAQHGSGDSLRCGACYRVERNEAIRSELDGKLCGCGLRVSARCPDGERCSKCNNARMNGGALCSFEGCDETQSSSGLCNGHVKQQLRGVELSPLGTSGGGYSASDPKGGFLYLVKFETGGRLVDGFGISNQVGARFKEHERNVDDILVRSWFWWRDASVAAEVERELGRFAVRDDSLPTGFRRESWPRCEATFRVAVHLIELYAPNSEYTKEMSDE